MQPPWYYFNFAVFSGVWTVAALAALVWPFARRRASQFVPYAFGLAWLLVALGLLSVVPEKKERYMLPLLPPLALLLTGLLRYWEVQFAAPGSRPRPDQWLLRGWAGILALACGALPVLVGAARLPGYTLTSPALVLTALVFVALAGLAGWAGWRQLPRPLMAASLLSMSALLGLVLPAYAALLHRRNEPGLRRLPQVAAAPVWQNLPWLALDGLPIEQVWAAGRAVPLWTGPADQLPPLPVVIVAASPLPAAFLPPGRAVCDWPIPTAFIWAARKRKDCFSWASWWQPMGGSNEAENVSPGSFMASSSRAEEKHATVVALGAYYSLTI
ncbi:hypothetical protein [Hymenobacter cellulosilyticus]|uniref:Uncharacterized protein n=1 Tax=Hymenobacter cellulosilyticus TaxID=2932248 RepID=A0A8T9Q7D3_9BACT|nr:hypothetical protein [Hymenobacter cellulosilyticus]UOQ73045.1 hypothetical protein MUN79_03455 [Hymenobacter cellulosilyticus]